MLTRSRRKEYPQNMDLDLLPKEVLIEILLLLDPEQLRVVCNTKSLKIREICSSNILKESVKKRYPKQIMIGKITYYQDYEKDTLNFKDTVGNRIIIKRDGSEIIRITYIPVKQINTMDSNSVVLQRHRGNPKIFIGSKNGVLDKKDADQFLKLLEKEGWEDPKIFYEDIRKALANFKIDRKNLWQILSPFRF